MSTSKPTEPRPDPDPATPAGKGGVTSDDLEHILRRTWEKNRGLLFLVLIAVTLAILGREGWRLYDNHRENRIRAAYAVAETPDELREFADAHGGHRLAGLARLSLADQAYAESRYAEAAEEYSRAAVRLSDLPLAGRARVGRAVSLILAGQTDEGIRVLEEIARDNTLYHAARNEARYHRAVLAMESGDYAKAADYIDEILQSDLTGAWAQRALGLQMRLPDEEQREF